MAATHAMTQRTRVQINTDVLIWARTTRSLSTAEAAQQLGVTPERLREWEEGREQPTPTQLRKIAKQYVRPICAFFLPAVPEGDEPRLKDFRRSGAAQATIGLSPELLVEIRLARERRAEALALAKEAGVDLPRLKLKASPQDDPEAIAAKFCDALQISVAERKSWNDAYRAFGARRAAVERLGVLVFQTGRSPKQFVELSETRGFSIAEDVLPIIVANGRDAPTARSFTLVHELAHLVLRNAGVCDFNSIERIEVFCNHIAGAVLLPEEALSVSPVVREHHPGAAWEDGELSRIARHFWVSQEVVLRRLLVTNRTTRDFYTHWRETHRGPFPERSQTRGTGRIPMSSLVIRRNGRLFPRLVFDALRERRISLRRASAYLGAGAQHLENIERQVFDPRYAR